MGGLSRTFPNTQCLQQKAAEEKYIRTMKEIEKKAYCKYVHCEQKEKEKKLKHTIQIKYYGSQSRFF